MDNTQVILILLGVIQFLMGSIGGWVLLQTVAHGKELATLEANNGENTRRFEELKRELDEIKTMLGKALMVRRNGDGG